MAMAKTAAMRRRPPRRVESSRAVLGDEAMILVRPLGERHSGCGEPFADLAADYGESL
jgi:hypothetical protein